MCTYCLGFIEREMDFKNTSLQTHARTYITNVTVQKPQHEEIDSSVKLKSCVICKAVASHFCTAVRNHKCSRDAAFISKINCSSLLCTLNRCAQAVFYISSSHLGDYIHAGYYIQYMPACMEPAREQQPKHQYIRLNHSSHLKGSYSRSSCL